MIQVSLENLNTFHEHLEDAEEVGGTFESFISQSGIEVNTFDDLLKARMAFQKAYLSDAVVDGENKTKYEFIATSNANEYILCIDVNLLEGIALGDQNATTAFLQQLVNLPDNSVLYIVPAISSSDSELGFFIGNEITALMNMIKAAVTCKTVFIFGAMVGVVELLIGMFCDDIEIGDYSGVSIFQADDGSHVLKAVGPAYKYLIKGVYNYWVDKGLFTAEEVSNLFSSELNYSIYLQRDEIQQRLNQ